MIVYEAPESKSVFISACLSLPIRTIEIGTDAETTEHCISACIDCVRHLSRGLLSHAVEDLLSAHVSKTCSFLFDIHAEYACGSTFISSMSSRRGMGLTEAKMSRSSLMRAFSSGFMFIFVCTIGASGSELALDRLLSTHRLKKIGQWSEPSVFWSMCTAEIRVVASGCSSSGWARM